MKESTIKRHIWLEPRQCRCKCVIISLKYHQYAEKKAIILYYAHFGRPLNMAGTDRMSTVTKNNIYYVHWFRTL